MSLLAILPPLLAVLAWGWLLALRGGFWRADVRLGEAPPPERWPEVVALIPARDEAGQIAGALSSHLAAGYPGRLSVIVIDDGSRDGTGRIAREIAEGAARPVRVVAAPPLPEGWSGKLWALETGMKAAAETAPQAEWVLLCDADIRLGPGTLGRLVAKAEHERLGLASLMARLDDAGLWGGLLIPAFVFFFQKLYPFRWVASRTHGTAAAAGGCVLARREVLARIGWPGAVRGALIDDCALARRMKGMPGLEAIWLGLADAEEAMSLRDNASLGAVWRMVKRTAFTQLRTNWGLLAGTVLGMALLYLAGPLAVLLWPLHGSTVAALLGLLGWGLAAVAYGPTLSHFGRPLWEAPALPLAGLLYTAMTLDSALAHARGQGGAWKGRTY